MNLHHALASINGFERKSPAELLDQAPPADRASEEAAIGCLLLLPGLIRETDLTAADFASEDHAIIFRAMLSLHAKGQPIDGALLVDELRRSQSLDDAGGMARLAELARSVPSTANFKFYVSCIKECTDRRRVIRVSLELVQLAFNGNVTPSAQARLLEALGNVGKLSGGSNPKELAGFRSFPVEALPEPCRRFVRAASKAIGCDPSFVALPLLSAVAAAVGNTHVACIKKGWTEPSVIWTAIVGQSGTLKSPALDAALRPIRRRQAATMKAHTEAMREYERDMITYEADRKEWERKGRKDNQPTPEPPTEPVCERLYCSDITVEALADRLECTPRGLFVVCDELAGWLNSFDQYKGGRGGDTAHWLTMHGARDLIVDRKTGDRRTIYVPRAAVSVTGGIQPEILKHALGREHFQDGLAARLLLAEPPVGAKQWTEAEINPEVEGELAELFNKLLAFGFDESDLDGPRPMVVTFSPTGRRAWIAFYDEHAREQAELTGDLAAAWSKLEGYAARLALIVHCVRVAANDRSLERTDAIDAKSVEAAVALVRWFGNEATRIYGMMGESEEDREQRELIDWIRRKGGRVTARDLARGPRKYRGDGEAEAALQSLVKARRGRWGTDDHQGGRGQPARVFVFGDVGDGDSNGEKTEKSEFVSPSPVSPLTETDLDEVTVWTA